MTEEDITTKDWIEYKKNATKYLEMHTQYATRKAIQIAIEKQIPIKPIGKTNICPKCGVIEFGFNEPNYCEWCGQKLKWE